VTDFTECRVHSYQHDTTLPLTIGDYYKVLRHCIAVLPKCLTGFWPMQDEGEKERRDSVSMVGPYARIRIIVAVICFIIAFGVIGFRALFG